jgi:hypothetical protein
LKASSCSALGAAACLFANRWVITYLEYDRSSGTVSKSG